MKILVTGSTGFVGQHLLKRLCQDNHEIIACSRRSFVFGHPNVRCCIVPDIDGATEWGAELEGVEAVIHLAGRTHQAKEDKDKLYGLYRKTNYDATARLARQASEAGVKRFIFASSIKVNGEGRATAYTEKDEPRPSDAYGKTKAEAEAFLHSISSEKGMTSVIFRPPLIYGEGMKGNLRALAKLIHMGLPLPFADINNKRSFLHVDNFVDVLTLALKKPVEHADVFLVSDGEDLSTSELIKAMGHAMGQKPLLFSVPPAFLRLAETLSGRKGALDRLFGSLTVDSQKIRTQWKWKPPLKLEEGLQKTFKSK